jgi:hypothetical protein
MHSEQVGELKVINPVMLVNLFFYIFTAFSPFSSIATKTIRPDFMKRAYYPCV